MADTTITTFDPALKQIYQDRNVEDLTYTDRPWFGSLAKFEGFGGRNMPVVLKYGNPMGRSATFTTAQANATAVLLKDFLLTRVNNYSVATITGEVVEATRGDNMAFLQALKVKIDSAMGALSDDLETSLFRDQNGYIGVIGSVTSANPMVVTLAQIENICNFEVGMVLLVDDTITGASPRATPTFTVAAGGYVAKLNRSLGTITTAFNNSGPTTDWAPGDYIFVSGDQSAKLAGLDAWLPASAPTSATFFNVDRTADSRLYGQVHDGSADTIETAIIDACSKGAREQGRPDLILLHHAQVRKLNKELGAKRVYAQVLSQSAKGDARVSYPGIKVDTDNGEATVLACNKCQANVGWCLEKKSWTLASLGPAVKMLQEDGLRILRQASADGYEVRIGFRGNLYTNKPISNVRVALATP